MAGITVSGLGSGLDVNNLVSQLVAAESQPTSKRLNTQEAKLQAELSAIGTVKGALSDFQSAQYKLTATKTFQSVKATAGDGSLLTASALNSAQTGTYSVEVKKLAQAQKLATPESNRFKAVTDTVGTGTLTIRFGSYSGGSFTPNPDRTAQPITIDAKNNTLAGVRDAINDANIGVRANIVNDGSGYRLALSATETGANNALEITVNDDDHGNADKAGLSLLAYDASVQNLTQTTATQDAEVVVDGLTVKSGSNTLNQVIQGVTLNLKAAGATTELTVAKDTGAASDAVKSFVDAYNKFIDTTSSLTAYDASTGKRGVLLGDFTMRSITSQLRGAIGTMVNGTVGDLHSLADIGISTQKDGKLALDSSKLQAALEADPDGVAGLFARAGRTSDPLVNFFSVDSKSQPGNYDVNVTQLATQGSYRNGAVTALEIDDTNDTFALKLDGVQSETITLTHKTYNSEADLAAELQSRINADTALKKAGAAVSVTYDADNDRFVFTSARYGSSSKVEFTAVDSATEATLGFALGAGTVGVDVAGTIGGVAATGSGQRLTGSDVAAGIAIDVLGGAIGSRGKVYYSDGIAANLDKQLTAMLKSDGSLSSRSTTLSKQIGRINDQRETLNQRMEDLEKRYRAQFMALDKLVNQLTATGNYLTQQLANLPGASND